VRVDRKKEAKRLQIWIEKVPFSQFLENFCFKGVFGFFIKKSECAVCIKELFYIAACEDAANMLSRGR